MSGAAPIVGAGDATGAADARAFARKGLTACVSRRATNADKLEALAQSIRDDGLLARALRVTLATRTTSSRCLKALSVTSDRSRSLCSTSAPTLIS